MVNKMEIDLVIGMIQSLITMIEGYNPSVTKSPIVNELSNAISAIQALGL